MIFAIWIAFGVHSMLKKYPNVTKTIYIVCILSVLLQPISYFISSQLIGKYPKILPINIRSVPYRNNASHFFWPPKINADGAEKYGQEVMEKLPKGSVILTDWDPPNGSSL